MPDPKHPDKFEDILLIAIWAMLCGAESFEDMELDGSA